MQKSKLVTSSKFWTEVKDGILCCPTPSHPGHKPRPYPGYPYYIHYLPLCHLLSQQTDYCSIKVLEFKSLFYVIRAPKDKTYDASNSNMTKLDV